MAYPEVETAVACAGTSLERAAYKIGGKAFLFLGQNDTSFTAMLKVGPSLAKVSKLAASELDCCKIGILGWVTFTFTFPLERTPPPPGLLEKWLAG